MTMNIEVANNILTRLGTQFDSHAFIRLFIQNYPSRYAKILSKHNNVNTAHGEIARFLNANAVALKIKLIGGNSNTPNIYNNVSNNAKWHKTV